MGFEAVKKVILVVADGDNYICFIEELLEEYGYLVLVAKDGIEATSLFEMNVDLIRLVLIDEEIQFKKAPEVIEEIAKKSKNNLKYILMSEDPPQLAPVLSKVKAPISLLAKPFLSVDLLKMVQTALI